MSRVNDRSSVDMNVEFRDAVEEDYPELFRLTLEGLGSSAIANCVTDVDSHPFHHFAARYGRVLVADLEGRVAGYGAIAIADNTRILSQLFVRASAQSLGIGSRLLELIDPLDGSARMLLATDDPRATALYIRRQYVPGWPVFTLELAADVVARIAVERVCAIPVRVDGNLLDVDQQITGRVRDAVFEYWLTAAGGSPHLIERNGELVGYGWTQDPTLGKLRAWYGRAPDIAIGPVGALTVEDAEASVLALIHRVSQDHRGRGVVMEIGGPHPALPTLLRAGGRITDVELAMSSHLFMFGDPERYVPSGGILY